MIQKIKDFIKEEYKFILFLILLYIILEFPLNYYIVVGGGIDDVSSRIQVEDGYTSKGSFNISYVTELQGTVLSYGLSYLIPSWERESADDYKYTTEESIEDIEFRSELDLKTANETATYWAYTLAGKDVKEISSKIYVIFKFEGYSSDIKIGDQIIGVDNQTFETVEEYISYIQTKSTDDTIELKVLRKGKEKVITCHLYEEEGRKLLGVALQIVKEYETDPKVNIQFKRAESGPSGGLITTLEIYNQLTKEDLTKNLKIAGTGTIEGNGEIGEIGGVEHKILGADHAKADYFLVPKGNYEEANNYKKEKNLKIKLIEVDTIQDAIEKIEALGGK